MFSYEYYDMVRLIPYILDDIPPPKNMLRCNRIQFWFWLILNGVVAFCYGAVYFYVYSYDIKSDIQGYLNAVKYLTFSYLAICILNIISGAYLGFSIN